MVTGEAVGLVEEDNEGIRSLGCLKILLRSNDLKRILTASTDKSEACLRLTANDKG